ncbi:heme-binding protein 2-like isoform X2 [Pistacia vera]|uniref:heme-binding protein 2-like isoform X2 n=1 Tax=Pistacia vera TaxID=55513 RepID=UPI001263B278|nr:heme-binding protein 2-like isoform X2 [Pistacia vera]
MRLLTAKRSTKSENIKKLCGFQLFLSILVHMKMELTRASTCNNEEAAQLNMTAPVFVGIIPSKDPLSNSTFVVNFLLPNNYQKNPPPSTLAHPVELPKQNYAAVRRFGGFISDNEIPLQVLALEKSLNGTKWESSIVKKSNGNAMTYTIAGYNSPFDKENRVNEIIFWFDK